MLLIWAFTDTMIRNEPIYGFANVIVGSFAKFANVIAMFGLLKISALVSNSNIGWSLAETSNRINHGWIKNMDRWNTNWSRTLSLICHPDLNLISLDTSNRQQSKFKSVLILKKILYYNFKFIYLLGQNKHVTIKLIIEYIQKGT